MALTQEQFASRIVAARALHGWNQKELSKRLHKEAGLDPKEGSKMEWKRPGFGATPTRRYALSLVTGLPEQWFEAPLEEVFGVGEHREDQLDRIEDAIAEVLAALRGASSATPGDPVEQADALVDELEDQAKGDQPPRKGRDASEGKRDASSSS